MKPIKILALILATIVFFSCSEEETVTESESIWEETKVFKYNNNGYIKSITTYNSNNIERSHDEFEYNTEKQLVKHIHYWTEKRTKKRDEYYTYGVNGYVKTQKEVYSSGSEYLINFDYEIAGNSIKVKDKDENFVLYTYEYKNGNLLFIKFAGNGEVVDCLNYDNKKNPYYQGFPLGYSIIKLHSKNNILKQRHSGNKNPKNNITVNYQYEYNSENFPTKKTYNGILITSDEPKPTKNIVYFKYEK